MTIPIVTIANKSDETTVIDALKLAFVGDPATRWVWPDTQKYLSNFSILVMAFREKAFAYKSVHYIENYSGAAIWLSPNVYPDFDKLISLLQSSGSDKAKIDDMAQKCLRR